MSETTGPERVRMHHVALTVTDLDASVDWYEQVFSVAYQMDAPHEGGTARILMDPEGNAGLRAAPTRRQRG